MNIGKILSLSILSIATLSACGIGDNQAEATLGGGSDTVLGQEGLLLSIGPDRAGGSFFSSRNNSTVLRGGVIGRGVANSSRLRKIVPVRLDSGISGFVADKAYIARQGSADETIRVVIPVKNTGSRFECRIALKGIIFRGAAGANLAIDDKDFVEGSVGRATTSTNTCLGPGEAGYSLLIEIPENGVRLFSETASIDVLGIDVSSDRFEPETTRVLPRSYVVINSDSRDYLVTVDNLGGRDVILDSVGQSVVILDNEGLPLDWDFLRFQDEQEEGARIGALLAVGSSIKLLAFSKFGGVSDSIRPIVNFDRSQSSPRRLGLADEYLIERREEAKKLGLLK
ncbi:MAG TPA: hypothetical protein ENK26_09105 [Gammaproteobacteria bacterium]|nr:hypothetical protein [Gammaproteobacteria bacterium]